MNSRIIINGEYVRSIPLFRLMRIKKVVPNSKNIKKYENKSNKILLSYHSF